MLDYSGHSRTVVAMVRAGIILHMILETCLLHIQRGLDFWNISLEVLFEGLDIYRLSDTACHYLDTNSDICFYMPALKIRSWEAVISYCRVKLKAEGRCRG